jgi:hypothetical protein
MESYFIRPSRPLRPSNVSDEINLSTGRPLISDQYDSNVVPETPEDMYWELVMEQERYPYEMTYSHVSSEEVHRYYWTGVVRDWHKVQVAMDRETQVMQRSN